MEKNSQEKKVRLGKKFSREKSSSGDSRMWKYKLWPYKSVIKYSRSRFSGSGRYKSG